MWQDCFCWRLSHYAYLSLFGISTGKLFILNLLPVEVHRNSRSSQAHDAEASRVVLLQLLDGAHYMHDNKLGICLLLLLGGEHLQRENTFDVGLGVPKAQCSVWHSGSAEVLRRCQRAASPWVSQQPRETHFWLECLNAGTVLAGRLLHWLSVRRPYFQKMVTFWGAGVGTSTREVLEATIQPKTLWHPPPTTRRTSASCQD